MVNLLTSLTPYIANFGYLIVAGFIIIEGIGVPLPGETVLVFVAAFTTTGKPSLALVIVVGAISAMLADTLGFTLGQRYGIAVINRFHRGNGDALARSRAFFAKHGVKAVFLARFIPVVRVFAAVLAGTGFGWNRRYPLPCVYHLQRLGGLDLGNHYEFAGLLIRQ